MYVSIGNKLVLNLNWARMHLKRKTMQMGNLPEVTANPKCVRSLDKSSKQREASTLSEEKIFLFSLNLFLKSNRRFNYLMMQLLIKTGKNVFCAGL